MKAENWLLEYPSMTNQGYKIVQENNELFWIRDLEEDDKR
jgi:hypothetical protein